MSKLHIKLVGLAISALLLATATAALVKHELTGSPTGSERGVLADVGGGVIWLAELPKYIVFSAKTLLAFNVAVYDDKHTEHAGFEGEPNLEELYLLQSRFDGDRGVTVFELVDLRTFAVQHTWMPDIRAFTELWNDQVAELYDDPEFIELSEIATHPLLTEDGGIVFNVWSNPLRKIDACSHLVWHSVPAPNELFHHSIETDIDGNIWSLGEDFHRIHPLAIDSVNGRPYRDNSIVKVSDDGEILFYKSISDILTEHGLGYLLWGTNYSAYKTDLLHANDVQPAYSDSEHWKKGDVLVSVRTPSLVFLYRPSTNELIWHSVGYATAQHDPNFLDDSRISIFDNNTPFGSRPIPPIDQTVVDETVWSSEHSQVIVYDFATQKYSTFLNASLQEADFKTGSQGRSDILPNGDLFLEETDHGRLLYFNADGSLRWSHMNRAEDGNAYAISWSRILYRDHEIEMVRDFLKNKDRLLAECN